MAGYEDIASMIDHSLLKPTFTDREIIEGCKIADQYRVASVCVRPADVRLAKQVLKNSAVLVSTVIGFPHGTTTTLAKVAEAQEAIDNGCLELDMVLHIGKMKSGDYDYVKKDLAAVISLAHAQGVKVKVIFENCYLTKDEIRQATLICNELKPDWIKTSTGYGTGGAEDEDIKIMRQYALPAIQVKAAGGIRTLQRAIEVKALGCTRFGCTATVTILDELKQGVGMISPVADSKEY